jgi:hypothetical protein
MQTSELNDMNSIDFGWASLADLDVVWELEGKSGTSCTDAARRGNFLSQRAVVESSLCS